LVEKLEDQGLAMPAMDNLIHNFILQDIATAMNSFEMTRDVEHQPPHRRAFFFSTHD